MAYKHASKHGAAGQMLQMANTPATSTSASFQPTAPPILKDATPTPPPMVQSHSVSPPYRLAPYGVRMSAYIADSLVMINAAFAVAVVVAPAGPEVLETVTKIVLWALLLFYRPLMDATGGTIGRALCGIRLVDQRGNPPSFWILFLRNALFMWFPPLAYITFGLRSALDKIFDHYVVEYPPTEGFRKTLHENRVLNVTITIMLFLVPILLFLLIVGAAMSGAR